jgi:hypothetical protein
MTQTVFTILCFVFGLPADVIAVIHLRKIVRENREARWGMNSSSSSHKGIAVPIILVVLASLCLVGGGVLAFLHPSNTQSVVNQVPKVPQAVPPSVSPTTVAPSVTTNPIGPKVTVSPSLSLPKAPRKPATQGGQPTPTPPPNQGGAQPTYQQRCEGGSPCAQGPGAQAVVNNGPPKYMTVLTPAKLEMFKTLVKPLNGVSVGFFASSATDDSAEFMRTVSEAAHSQGVIFDPNTPIIAGMPVFGSKSNGISISYPDEKAAEAQAIVKALRDSGLYSPDIPRVPGIGKEGMIGLYIAPQ